MFKVKWDPWQKEVLSTEGSLAMRCGRQVGKSEVVSEKACLLAINHPGTITMVIAPAQRQSGLLFEKITAKLLHKKVKLLEKPTKTRVKLANGSIIYALPAGRTGYSIRGYTLDFLIVDEAAFVPQTVWTAVTPMMAVSQQERGFGWIIMLSTPFGKGGYYFDAFANPAFTTFHISAEDCPRLSKKYLQSEKKRMSKLQYAQEYLAEFIEDHNQFFPTTLIKQQMTFIEWNKNDDAILGASYYLGIDLARYGGDAIAYVIVEFYRNRLKVVKTLTRERVNTLETVGETVVLHQEWGFKKIFIDSGGLGQGVLDIMQSKLGKRRVVGIDNSSKAVQVQGEEKRNRIMKEDLYSNTLVLLESGKLELIADNALIHSMTSIIFTYTEEGKLKLFGRDSHLTEALIRACWCVKERGLRLFVA